MRAHFKDALLIRQAVVAGAPDQAVYPARILALIENLDDLPPGWRDYVERMQQAAMRITDGTSMARAASAVADIGVACGQCHRQLGGPAVSNDPRPPQGATLQQGMERHAWATERLWEGIVVPSSEAWSAGVDALSVPFPDAVSRRGVAARAAAADFESIVEQAKAKKVVEERAALYARLLVTCAACHRAGKR
jgi:cytochrome c553